MTGRPLIAPFANLRRTLAITAPGWLEASEQIWHDWQEAAGRELPDGRLPRVFAVARITCVEDIPLHAGLLQIMRHQAVQAFAIFVLPNTPTLEIVRWIALREGWASLVGLTIESDVSSLVARLPRDGTLALFPYPSLLVPSSLEKGLAGEAIALAQGAYCGPPTLSSPWGRPEDIDVSSLFESVEETVPPLPFPIAHGLASEASPCSKLTDAEIWLRPMAVELPGSTREDWIVATLRSDAQGEQVVASQPACFADLSGNLTVPLIPRFASEVMRTLQLRSLSANEVAVGREISLNVPPQNIAPWMVSAYLNRGGAGNQVIRAFAHGLSCRIAYAEDEGSELQDIPVVWGVLRESDRILAQARAQGLHFFYVDHAYFNRGHGNSYRITRNAYDAGRVRKVGDSRLKMLNLDVQPWRKSGRSIIVCPPTEHFAAAHNCSDWLETTLCALKLETDRPIVIRTKPRPGEGSVPLVEALQDAHALVTHSSNVAIEAVCLGTPVFVSPTSAAAPVGRTDIGMIESPRYPKREGWLAHLAYSQYSLEEIRDGSAWNLLMHLEDRDFVRN